jgi:undecaprenyl-diphosphatase
MPGTAGTGWSSHYVGTVLRLARGAVRQLLQPPSHSSRAEAARRLARHWLLMAIGGGAVIAGLMVFLDAWEIGLMPPRGTTSLWPLRVMTGFGKAENILWGLAAALLIVVLVAARLHGPSRARLAAVGLRLQYLFLAVLVPVLAGEVIKGAVGRGRPFAGGHADAFNYSHFAWTERYASFPSGHATASFALAFAVAALWPRMRVAAAIYALLIIATRLVLLAHHPSDVTAGALLGVAGAMLVRYWFAARHLCFSIDRDGRIAPLAGPSPDRFKGVAGDVPAP